MGPALQCILACFVSLEIPHAGWTEIHLPELQLKVQGPVLAGDVETEGSGDRSGWKNYLLFSLLQRLSQPWHENRLRVSFWKICLFSPFTLYQLWTSHTQTQPGTFTWRWGPVVLGRYTLDEFGTARRSAVVRGFIDALTRGGPGGTPRPIEMHSHDPMRYIFFSRV